MSTEGRHAESLSRRGFFARALMVTGASWLVGLPLVLSRSSAALLAGGRALLRPRSSLPVPTALYDFVAAMPSSREHDIIGLFRLTAATQRELVQRVLARWSSRPRQAEAPADFFGARIEQDFRDGRWMSAGGWLLSRTEVALLVLADYAQRDLLVRA